MMSDDINERLREKTVQIVSLNQKMEALQAQLAGSQKRANQLGNQVTELEASISERDSRIQILESQLANTKGALDAVGKEMQDIKAEQTHLLTKKQPGTENLSLKESLAFAEMTVERLREDLKIFSQTATSVLNQEEGALEKLKQVLLEFGDPKYRILNMVLNRKSIRLEEIASALVLDMTQALKHVEALQAEGEVEIRDGNNILPASKYRELKVPREEWKQLDPTTIFERLEEFVGKTDDSKSIVSAMETAVDVLEQKLARGGALIFQMRKTADAWKKETGSIEELQYTVRDWKARAQVLT
jgi:chromosome segregation ATPase